MALRLLQQRLMERERAYDKLHSSLIERFGDEEVSRLTMLADDQA